MTPPPPAYEREPLEHARARWRMQAADVDHRTPVPKARWRTHCARCGDTDRLRHFWIADDTFGPRIHSVVALCWECDNLQLALGGRLRPGLRAAIARLLATIRSRE